MMWNIAKRVFQNFEISAPADDKVELRGNNGDSRDQH